MFFKKKPESSLFAYPASLFINEDSVGGHIYLYNNHFEFRCHRFNIARINFEMPYERVTEVILLKQYGKIEIRLIDGNNLIFIVKSKKDFYEKLNHLRNK